MADLSTMLATQLATYLDLSLQARQAHWCVTGPNFIGLHELFGDLYEAADGWADTIAERARALGYEALGTADSVIQRSVLGDYSPAVAAWDEHVSAICTSLKTCCGASEDAIQASLQAKDQATADIFIEIVRAVDTHRYLIGSHKS